jgi:hypothetical protein
LAVRIFPSAHTNPIFVKVNNREIREKRSIQWCIDSVEQCWKEKVGQIRETEREEARAAYDEAIRIYTERLSETNKK